MAQYHLLPSAATEVAEALLHSRPSAAQTVGLMPSTEQQRQPQGVTCTHMVMTTLEELDANGGVQ